ncbi:hypothetical protein RJT34_15431 [Clitoria ternatea]|uniref:Response regulatory domain-containing protein n=1 Tax=Clitoria ternatea TaxID=43366 RepID=A0AAN9PBF0_CLITE
MDAAKFKPIDFKSCLVPCIKILVVDSDLKCLQILSNMLCSLGNEEPTPSVNNFSDPAEELPRPFVTASQASQALSIFEEKKNELDLLVVEVDLPDMEIDEFTEKIRESSNIAYCLMTADNNAFSQSSLACKGATLYLKKPIMVHDLTDLWKFKTPKSKNNRMANENVRGSEEQETDKIVVTNSQECQPFMSKGEQNLQSAKRKEEELHDKGKEQAELLVPLRKQFNWSNDVLTKFMRAINVAGPDASPNQIQQLMNMPEVAIEGISSYLQRYRLFLAKASQVGRPPKTSKKPTSDSNLGQKHGCQINEDNKKCPLFIEKPGETCQYRQIYLCNCMQTFKQGSSGEVSNLEKNIGVPLQVQAVAHNTSGSGKFINYSDLVETFAGTGQVEKTTYGEVFNGEGFVYRVGDIAEQSELSTQLANGMFQQFTPLLSGPLLLPDEKEHGVFGVEAEKFDEILYPPRGTQMFSDQDLNRWLSSFPRNADDAVA